jgi:hypothetical protein
MFLPGGGENIFDRFNAKVRERWSQRTTGSSWSGGGPTPSGISRWSTWWQREQVRDHARPYYVAIPLRIRMFVKENAQVKSFIIQTTTMSPEAGILVNLRYEHVLKDRSLSEKAREMHGLLPRKWRVDFKARPFR